MGVEYYIFALFVFGLAALVVVMLVKGIKKNKTMAEREIEEKEKKVMMLYFEVEDMIEEMKGYVEAQKASLDANIHRIETDMAAVSMLKESMKESFGALEAEARSSLKKAAESASKNMLKKAEATAKTAADEVARAALVEAEEKRREQEKREREKRELEELAAQKKREEELFIEEEPLIFPKDGNKMKTREAARRLYEQGMGIDQIASRMHLSKGEVVFMLRLAVQNPPS